MSTLRNATIRLAFENPEMREHLVPLLTKQARPFIEEDPREDVLQYGHNALTSFVHSQNPWFKVTTGMFHRNGGKPKFTWTVSDDERRLFTVSAIRHNTVSFSRRDGEEDDSVMVPSRWVWGAIDDDGPTILGSTASDLPRIPSRELKIYISRFL